MEVLDKDTLTSDLVGKCFLQVEDLCINGGVNEWVEIHYDKLIRKNLSGGKIHIITKWTKNESGKAPLAK
jgi:hypothetical protein